MARWEMEAPRRPHHYEPASYEVRRSEAFTFPPKSNPPKAPTPPPAGSASEFGLQGHRIHPRTRLCTAPIPCRPQTALVSPTKQTGRQSTVMHPRRAPGHGGRRYACCCCLVGAPRPQPRLAASPAVPRRRVLGQPRVPSSSASLARQKPGSDARIPTFSSGKILLAAHLPMPIVGLWRHGTEEDDRPPSCPKRPRGTGGSIDGPPDLLASGAPQPTICHLASRHILNPGDNGYRALPCRVQVARERLSQSGISSFRPSTAAPICSMRPPSSLPASRGHLVWAAKDKAIWGEMTDCRYRSCPTSQEIPSTRVSGRYVCSTPLRARDME